MFVVPDETLWSHAGDCGDLIAGLCAMAVKPGPLRLVRHDCTGSRMTPERAESLRPLLEKQPYIRGVEWREDYVGNRLDVGVRSKYRNGLNLADMQCAALGVPHWPREQPWLTVYEPRRAAPVLIARSNRYRGWTFPWQKVWEKYHLYAMFVGTPEEHADFCQGVGPIAYLHTPDFLALAEAVAGADLVVSNQTAVFWVAEGLKKPVVLEAVHPHNCHFARPGFVYATNEHVVLPDLPEAVYRREMNLSNLIATP